MNIVKYAISRLKEPSTWAGVTAVALGLGLKLDPSLSSAITQTGIAVAGLLAFFLPESA